MVERVDNPLLVFCVCSNSFSQTWWLKVRDICSLSVLEATVGNQDVGRASLLEFWGDDLCLPTSGSWPTSWILWLVATSPQSVPLHFAFFSICSLYLRTFFIGFKAFWVIQDDFISWSLTDYYCKDPYFKQGHIFEAQDRHEFWRQMIWFTTLMQRELIKSQILMSLSLEERLILLAMLFF